MAMLRWTGVSIFTLAPLTFSAAAIAQAQVADWPTRTVTTVTGFAPGGNSDVLARLLTNRMAEQFKQPFVVEGRVGASGAVAMRYVGQSEPDGYTLFFAAAPQIGVLPYIQKLSFEPLKILTPVSVFATGPFLLVVNASAPVSTVAEFIQWAKTHKLNYATGGAGSNAHLTAAVFFSRIGAEALNIPFRGSGASMVALISNQVDFTFGNASDVMPYVDSGKVKILGVAADHRMKQLPDVPTISETVPGPPMPSWNGVMVPAKTPKPIVDKIAAQVIAAAKDPAIVEKLMLLGLEPNGTTPEEFAAQIQHEQPEFDAAIAAAGLKQQ